MSVNRINDFTITEFIDLEAYHRNTGMLDFRLEEIQELTLKAQQDKKELTGRNKRVIGYKKSGKKLSGEGRYALVSAGLMKAQTGGEISDGTFNVRKAEYKTVSGAVLTTDAKATGTEGAEIGYIKTLAENGAVSATYEQAAAADASHFAYDPLTRKLTLPVSDGGQVIADGTPVVYAYEREVSGTKVTDPTDSFSEVREVWIHCFGTDACDNEYYASIYIPRADFSGEFSLDLGGDQTVQNFSFDAMADLCGGSKGSELFELIVYTE